MENLLYLIELGIVSSINSTIGNVSPVGVRTISTFNEHFSLLTRRQAPYGRENVNQISLTICTINACQANQDSVPKPPETCILQYKIYRRN